MTENKKRILKAVIDRGGLLLSADLIKIVLLNEIGDQLKLRGLSSLH